MRFSIKRLFVEETFFLRENEYAENQCCPYVNEQGHDYGSMLYWRSSKGLIEDRLCNVHCATSIQTSLVRIELRHLVCKAQFGRVVLSVQNRYALKAPFQSLYSKYEEIHSKKELQLKKTPLLRTIFRNIGHWANQSRKNGPDSGPLYLT